MFDKEVSCEGGTRAIFSVFYDTNAIFTVYFIFDVYLFFMLCDIYFLFHISWFCTFCDIIIIYNTCCRVMQVIKIWVYFSMCGFIYLKTSGRRCINIVHPL